MSSATDNDASEVGQSSPKEMHSGVSVVNTGDVIHLPPSTAYQNSAAPDGSNHLGEPEKSNEVVHNSLPGSDQPKSFWQLSASELVAYIFTKNAALRADILGDVFISYDLSTQNLLELLTIETKDQLFAEIGLDPKTKILKSRLFESLLIGEIAADQSVAEHHRKYWLNYQKSKQEARSSVQFTPEKTILISGGSENTGVAKRLAFGEETPKFLSLPGVEGSIPTPSFYKHIQGSTNSFFHMLDPKPASLKPELLQMGDGKLQFQFNMMPTPTVLHPFPTLAVFSKLTVPQFLLDYKIAQLGASKGAKKSLKECINPLIWNNIAKLIGVNLTVFEESTNDQTIYAALLKKFGATTCDEAMIQLKEIRFEFDDSTTPQEHFAGVLATHFTKFREQLTQYMFCQFAPGKELTPEAYDLSQRYFFP